MNNITLKIQLILVICFLMMAINNVAAEIDLKQAWMLAKEHDSKLAAADYALQSTQETLPLARAALKPQIELFGNAASVDQDTDYQGVGPFSDRKTQFDNIRYGMTITQPLFRKDRWEASNQAERVIEQGGYQYQLALQKLTLDVAQAYFDLMLAFDDVELSQVEKKSTEKQLQRAKRAFEIGSSNITDVHTAQAGFDLTQAAAIGAESMLEINQQKLSRLTGKIPDQPRLLKRDFKPLLLEPNDINKWAEKVNQQNLLVKVAEKSVEIANIEIKKVRGSAWPSLDLVASYLDNRAGDSSFGVGINTKEAKVALDLRVPLYAGGAVSAKSRSLIKEKTRALYLLEDTKREYTLQAQQLFLAMTNGIRQINALQQVVTSTLSSFNSTQKGLDLGLRSLVDVLASQQLLFQAKRNLAAAKYQYLLNRMRLKATVNELNEDEVNYISSLLE